MRILEKLTVFQRDFQGEILADDAIRLMYATDASAYREVPLAVTYPKNNDDLKKLILFARENHTRLSREPQGHPLPGR